MQPHSRLLDLQHIEMSDMRALPLLPFTHRRAVHVHSPALSACAAWPP